MKNYDPHVVSPAEALGTLALFEGPVLLDLDETLYLRNSTEDFIDSAWPGILVFAVLKALDILRPWRLTGGAETRDVWRVRLVRTLFPWVSLAWRTRCKTLAEQFANRPLIDAALRRSARPTIVTVGFRPIVTPLIDALGLSGAPIVAASVKRFRDRSEGKLRLAVDALGEDTVRRSLVITDSISDLPLLEACTRPLRVIWPQAFYRAALSGLYYPGRYLMKVKRPDDRPYIVRSVLWEDFTLWVLCSVGLAAAPVQHVVGLLLLLISFWSIYERGYVDNDLVAHKFESKPRLSGAFGTVEVATPRLEPWIWALVLGLVAAVVLRWPKPPSWVDFGLWATVLVSTSLWFWFYNRLDKATRVWPYLGLQLFRSGAFLVLVPVVPIAAFAVGAHVFSKWIPYILYRTRREGEDWPEMPAHLIRALCFAMLCVLLILANGPTAVLQGSVAALILFFGWKSRREFLTVVRSARRIDR